jgi:D-alanine-D-alanine ligase
MYIGILFDSPSDYPLSSGPSDRFAEFEPESTILIMEEAVRLCGHIPVRVGAPARMMEALPEIDVMWNIAEGYGTRNREAWGPVLAEMRGIPYLGSDALTLSMSLDKHRSKQLAGQCGVPTAPWRLLGARTPVQEVPPDWYPVFVKPRYEGTAKGIGPWSRCEDPSSLAELRDRLVSGYRQDVLVEPWLPGAEYTIALAGAPLRALPVLERALHKPTGIGIHAISAHDPQAEQLAFTHGAIDPTIEQKLEEWSLAICREMEVRHFARLDFKCDAQGHPQFLEINPLPTFAADNTFGILAEIEGCSPAEYLAGFLPEWIQDAVDTF